MNGYLPLIHANKWWINLGVVLALLSTSISKDTWFPLIGAFVVFCLAQTACYLIQDLIQEKHPGIASGKITSGQLINVIRILIVVSLGLAFFISKTLLFCLLVYLALTSIYLFFPLKSRWLTLVYGVGIGCIFYFVGYGL